MMTEGGGTSAWPASHTSVLTSKSQPVPRGGFRFSCSDIRMSTCHFLSWVIASPSGAAAIFAEGNHPNHWNTQVTSMLTWSQSRLGGQWELQAHFFTDSLIAATWKQHPAGLDLHRAKPRQSSWACVEATVHSGKYRLISPPAALILDAQIWNDPVKEVRDTLLERLFQSFQFRLTSPFQGSCTW